MSRRTGASFLEELPAALRRLARRPATALAGAGSLTLGLGAAIAAFALVDGILLAPLPYPEPDRLVRIHATHEGVRQSPNARLAAIWDRLPVPYPRARDLEGRSGTLRALALWETYEAVLEGAGEARREPAARVEAELLDLLGARAALGRRPTADEVARGEPVVLLSHGLWREAFGADPRVVGRTVRLDGESVAVVGVLEPGFRLPAGPGGPEGEERLWTPLVLGEEDRGRRDGHRFTAVGRLAPAASAEEADAEAARIAADLAAEHPASDAELGFRVVPLAEAVVGEAGRLLALLAAAAAVVLLLAIANVVHLLLVEAVERRRELALRAVLGAGRSRLLAGQAAEALVLAALGGAGGLALAGVLLRVLPRLLAAELPRLDEVALDPRAAGFAVAASLGAALLAAAVPALGLGERGLERRVRRLSGRATAGRRERAAHDALVVAEVALALVLVAVAFALAAGWLRQAARDPGLEASGVLVQELRLPEWRYPDEVARRRFGARLLDRLAALPGVEAAALADRLPVPGPARVAGFRVAGRDAPAPESWVRGRSALLQHVTSEYFRLLAIPRVEGRAFAAGEADGPGTVVVDRALAGRHWPRGDAVGSRVVMGEATHEVVGVVDAVAAAEPVERSAAGPTGTIYRPWETAAPASVAVLLRAASGRPEALAPALRRALRELDPALAPGPAEPLETALARPLEGPRSRVVLLALSAGVALVLALLGVYGVTGHAVARRRRELGVRMALGADRRRIRRDILARALRPIAAGLILGGLAGAAALRGLELAADAGETGLVLAGAAALVAAAGLAAAWGPARRAARVPPAASLAVE